MLRRLCFVIFFLFCCSAVCAQRFLFNSKFTPQMTLTNDGSLGDAVLDNYIINKRAFAFQAARGKKRSIEKRYSYFPSRG